jgi:hypothetical protein
MAYAGSSYFKKVESVIRKLPDGLVDLDITRIKPRRPNLANSEFLINRHMGDWSEKLVRTSIESATNKYIAVKYGRSQDIVPGEPGFNQFYDDYQGELDEFGKRPDLLIFRKRDYHREDEDLSDSSNDDISDLVPKAILGLEVRCSSYLSKKFKPGKSNPLGSLTFTIKVEDIVIVLNWIRNTGVRHRYVQVFFDEVHSIGFYKALKVVAEGTKNEDYTVNRVPKNQFKTTINVPLDKGTKIGDIADYPEFAAYRRELASGRLLHPVKFSGSTITLTPGVWKKVFDKAVELKSSS